MAKLAQTYIRFRRIEIDESGLQIMARRVEKAARAAAREAYEFEVSLDVYLEAGSLFVRITVIGSLVLALYHEVGHYEKFKEGISLLVEDAEKYGNAIYQKVLKVTGVPKADAVSKRPMTPGKIDRVIKELEHLRQTQERLPVDVLRIRLQRIAQSVRAIERDLGPAERAVLRDQPFIVKLARLPPPAERPEEERLALTTKQTRLIAGPPGRKTMKLRYHNRFHVSPRKKSTRR